MGAPGRQEGSCPFPFPQFSSGQRSSLGGTSCYGTADAGANTRHQADEIIRNDSSLNHEYLPIAGLASFTSKACALMLGGDSPAIADGRVTSVQTISGTGAVHLGALFLARFFHKGNKTVYLSNPTWANHNQIFSNVGPAHGPVPLTSTSGPRGSTSRA